MKKLLVFLTVFCALCTAPGAQVFYEGQGGRTLGGIRVSGIVPTGLSNDEAELIPLIQMTLGNDFNKYAGMTVPALEDTAFSTRYTLTGTISKIGGAYRLAFVIRDNSSGTQKTSYGPMQCTLGELQSLKGIKAASEELITGMGVTLTQAGKNALRTTATNEAEAMNALAKSAAAGVTDFERAYYTYEASRLDPTLTEAARRLAAYQMEIYKAPEISLALPDIRIPKIRVPEFKAPEIRMAATGNIGTDARRQQQQYEAQREASRQRQESGNRAIKDLQDAFLAQFKAQSEAVKEQQAGLMEQQTILLGQQETLLMRQGQMIAQLRETENSYDTFFTEHPPFEIIYDPKAAPVGNANLEKGTIDLQFRIASAGTNAMGVIPLMLADFEKGLGTISQGLLDINGEFDKIQSLFAQVEAAGEKALAQLVNDYAAQMTQVQTAENDYAAQLARLDRELNTSGYTRLGQDYAVRPDTGYAERLAGEYAVRPAGYNAVGDKTLGDFWTLTKWNKDESRTFDIEARLGNEAGRIIGRATVNLTNRILAAEYTRPRGDSAFCVFRDVSVRDITDTLKVSIQEVNGKNVTIATNAGYIKISPLEADGYTRDGWDIDGYGRDGFNKEGYNRLGYDRDGFDKDGYNSFGFDKAGYDRDGYDQNGYYKTGYDRDGFDKNGRNISGQTRQEAEKAAEIAARQAREQDIWGHYYLGFFIEGVVNMGPLGGLGGFGLELGGKWLMADASLSWGGGSLELEDEIEKQLGPIFWDAPHIFSPRIGAAIIPLRFEWARLSIGGGFEFLQINIYEYRGKTKDGTKGSTSIRGELYERQTLDTLVIPYVEARLDIAFSQKVGFMGLMGFIGYRCEFPPADKFGAYFGKPVSMRHSLFIGLEGRGVFK